MNLVDLSNKNILVGVTGSISAYKACELVRLFVKSGANVNVVMSQSATKFVSPLTFEALTRNKVLTNSTEDWSSNLNHIELSQNADAFVIAPATANTINRVSKGITGNILLDAALAYNKNLIVAPAANTQMLQNHYTQGSLKMLAVNDVKIVQPQTKKLACGTEGIGALAEPIDIYYATAREILKDDFWNDRRVVVTGGGTIERIDDVRFISNFSSGKMANALATALYLKGADVCLITTKPTDDIPKDIYVIDVESANEMHEFVIDSIRVAKKGVMSKASLNNPNAIGMIQKTPYLFMAAAVADYRPKYPQNGKLKKDALGDEWALELVKNEDILSNIDKSGIITIGFKAEKDKITALENGKNMLINKNLDAVCLNILGKENNFGSDLNEITFITKSATKTLPLKSKTQIAFEILEEAKKLDG